MTAIQDQAEFEQLPDLYQRWVTELLPDGIPREREATCLDCAMCGTPGEANLSALVFYNRETKCCTYFPELPNFLVGRAVAVDTPGGEALRRFIEDDGDSRGLATLRSVRPHEKITTVYVHHRAEGFGQDPEMACPYAIDGGGDVGRVCGIWKHRNSVCSTWFCKHTKGVTGFYFWRALQGWLDHLERAMSWWAISQVLDTPAAVLSAGEYRVNQRHEITLRDDAWSHWPGSRSAFYEACADKVEGLSAAEVVRIAGVEAQLHLVEVGTRLTEVHATLPPARLKVAPYSIIQQEETRTILQAHHWPEALHVPNSLIPVLRYFDGSPTETTLERIRVATQIRLSPGLVRRLYDFGILEKISGVGPG